MFKLYNDFSNLLFSSLNEGVTNPNLSGLRLKLAAYYLSRYRNIVLWGTGINPAPVKFDSLYTDMQYVRIHRAASDREGNNLKHYTEMLVRKFNDTNSNKLKFRLKL